jgi:hypothetical protein
MQIMAAKQTVMPAQVPAISRVAAVSKIPKTDTVAAASVMLLAAVPAQAAAVLIVLATTAVVHQGVLLGAC